MKLTGYEDLRVQKTINSIYDAFETLILANDYEKITVTALAKLAQINKKTFYRYYPTMDDLLSEMQSRYSQGYLQITAHFQYPRDIAKSVRSFFEYSAVQGPAYDRITISGAYSGIRQQMVDQVMSKTWGASPEFQKLADWQKQMLLSFVQDTGLRVYHQWIDNNRSAPLEDVITLATALMQGGVEKLLSAFDQ
ncbi:TetR/AcrR family transcriptional regulator [Lapidilactobacillus achengensis]|uniref:TetR/AcrR family transcriptional regulator n=1 Tax=Lapidilactobacillus achengensis TaxID=2486000 RepID=A0ABW1UNL6_9LACO|nr:TetR/AcrR family transcriptional regulator [Lapidilactobacillus achengensis]